MSAFVVEDKTINGVVSFLAHGRGLEWLRRQVAESTGCDLETVDGRENLARAMFALNIRAVDARYGEGQAQEFRPLNFEFRRELQTSALQAYASLRCWLYQCSEGDVPESSSLYVAMTAASDSLAHHIVRALPEYDRTQWG